MGGDEFAMILRDIACPTEAVPVAERLIAVVSEPFGLNGHTVLVGASIGIASAPEDGELADLLQIRADLALYAAKAAGRSTWRRFSDLARINSLQA
jgi:diguanylate cyclase (GGDEF)-like protein